jgi:selenide,water dikinase
MREEPLKLTALSSTAGCAAKLSQQALAEVLGQLPRAPQDRNVLVGTSTGDDAGVYRLDQDRALVQTLDFFTPIVDDAFAYGQISATNSLSDVYAMGGTPLTAMNIVGTPDHILPPATLATILRGGLRKVLAAGAVLIGGHTIRSPEPIYGLSVTGLVHPGLVLTNAGARAGDLLVLTKPLGTGVITTALKQARATGSQMRAVIRAMTKLNDVGPVLAKARLVHAATDVTGFGLLGHLYSMCKASHVAAELWLNRIPRFRGVDALIEGGCVPGGTRRNLEFARASILQAPQLSDAQKLLLADAQTSGGLLLSIAPKHEARVRRMLSANGTLASAVIGRIAAGGKPRISVTLTD